MEDSEQISEESKTITIDLEPDKQHIRASKLYFGDPLQFAPDSSFLIYTLGNQLLVNTKTCSSCQSQYYDMNQSSSMEVVQAQEQWQLAELGSFSGVYVRDKVCLKYSLDSQDVPCADSKFLAVDKVGELLNHVDDGVLGIGLSGEFGTEPDLIADLVTNGQVTEAKVSLWTNQESLQSKLTLGGVAPNSIKGEQFTHKFSRVTDTSSENDLWALALSDVLLNDDSVISSGANLALLASSMPYIYLNKNDYSRFVQRIKDISSDFICDPHFICYSLTHSCYEYIDMLPDLTIRLDSINYTLPPIAYTQSFGTQRCNILLKQSSDLENTVVLGSVFLQNFVATFDYRNKAIELAANANAPNGTRAEVYHGPDDSGWRAMNIFGLALIAFMIICVIIVCIICRIRANKQAEKDVRALAYLQQEEQTAQPLQSSKQLTPVQTAIQHQSIDLTNNRL